MTASKGRDFEQLVHAALVSLEAKFPECVKVTAQASLGSSVSGRPHRPDFELEYKLGGLRHQHLIECQNRNRSSHEIADKIFVVRGTSDRNRYMLVYKDPDYLSQPVKKRLASMGVLHFNFEAFKRDFLEQLEADLALRRIGLRVYKWPLWLLQRFAGIFHRGDATNSAESQALGVSSEQLGGDISNVSPDRNTEEADREPVEAASKPAVVETVPLMVRKSAPEYVKSIPHASPPPVLYEPVAETPVESVALKPECFMTERLVKLHHPAPRVVPQLVAETPVESVVLKPECFMTERLVKLHHPVPPVVTQLVAEIPVESVALKSECFMTERLVKLHHPAPPVVTQLVAEIPVESVALKPECFMTEALPQFWCSIITETMSR